MTLDDLPQILDNMLSKQKEKRAKTFVARYKNKNLIMRSGKSSWKAVNHAKSAIIRHFHNEEVKFVDGNRTLRYGDVGNWEELTALEKQFRAKLFELIEIVELTD